MGRARTPIGEHGVINSKEVELGKWRARTRYRFEDGKTRTVERFGATRPKAERALKDALKTIDPGRGGAITSTTSLTDLGAAFLNHKRAAGRSEGTLETYGYAVSAHITPSLGDLTVAEATTGRLQTFINRVKADSGHGAAKNCRSTLSGMMQLAVANDAVATNPVREVERIERPKGVKGASAIALKDLPGFLGAVRANADLKRWDTVELVEFMLAAGWRISEVCALEASSVDFDAGTATVEAAAVRVKGQGMVRQPFAKTEQTARTTPLPEATMELLRQRVERLGPYTDLVFPTPLMTLRDPSNTQRELRDVRDGLGMPKLSTHTFRKTVASLLDQRGLSPTEVADYIGHENPAVTLNVYMKRTQGSAKAAKEMASLLDGLI